MLAIQNVLRKMNAMVEKIMLQNQVQIKEKENSKLG